MRRKAGGIVGKLRQRREQRTLTQEELARAVHVSRQTINALETGRYRPSTLLALKLASVLDTSVEDLFSLEEADWR